MPDVVVTVPQSRWADWIAEGDWPGEPWSGLASFFRVGFNRPRIEPGERVYVVAHGKLRGYAPLVGVEADDDGLSRTDISGLCGRHAPAARIDQALAMLLAAGRARRERRDTGGRPMEVWLRA